MPVLFDSATYFFDTSVSATDTATGSHIVSTLATDRAAILAVGWFGSADASGGTVTATFGDDAMTAGTPVRWNSDKCALFPFKLEDPDTGSKTITVSFSSMGGAGGVLGVCSTYSGVASIGDVVTAGGSNTASNAVTVSSDDPCDRVVSAHAVGVGGPNWNASFFTTYDKTGRMYPGPVMIQDSAGSASVTNTATQNSSTTNWGAFGYPLEASPVSLEAALSIPVSLAASASIYRVETPAPNRTWVIK